MDVEIWQVPPSCHPVHGLWYWHGEGHQLRQVHVRQLDETWKQVRCPPVYGFLVRSAVPTVGVFVWKRSFPFMFCLSDNRICDYALSFVPHLNLLRSTTLYLFCMTNYCQGDRSFQDTHFCGCREKWALKVNQHKRISLWISQECSAFCTPPCVYWASNLFLSHTKHISTTIKNDSELTLNNITMVQLNVQRFWFLLQSRIDNFRPDFYANLLDCILSCAVPSQHSCITLFNLSKFLLTIIYETFLFYTYFFLITPPLVVIKVIFCIRACKPWCH